VLAVAPDNRELQKNPLRLPKKSFIPLKFPHFITQPAA
jgi:hypothetical protein